MRAAVWMLARSDPLNVRQPTGKHYRDVYGMNSAGHPATLPEFSWPYAYPAVMLGMGNRHRHPVRSLPSRGGI